MSTRQFSYFFASLENIDIRSLKQQTGANKLFFGNRIFISVQRPVSTSHLRYRQSQPIEVKTNTEPYPVQKVSAGSKYRLKRHQPRPAVNRNPATPSFNCFPDRLEKA